LAPHHVIVVNPYYGDSCWFGDIGDAWRLGGAELGYRTYSRSTGAHGGFVGVFAGAAHGEIEQSCGTCRGDSSKLWFSTGIDAGYQWVMDDGFTVGVGAGFGVHWTDDDVTNLVALPLPRLLLTLGVTP
jgi:hypothetical protein